MRRIQDMKQRLGRKNVHMTHSLSGSHTVSVLPLLTFRPQDVTARLVKIISHSFLNEPVICVPGVLLITLETSWAQMGFG